MFNGVQLTQLHKQLKGKRFYSKTGVLNFSLKEVKEEMTKELDEEWEDLKSNYDYLGCFRFSYYGATKGSYKKIDEEWEKSLTDEEIYKIKIKLVEIGEYSPDKFKEEMLEFFKNTFEVQDIFNPPELPF